MNIVRHTRIKSKKQHNYQTDLRDMEEELKTTDWVFVINNPDSKSMEKIHSINSEISYLVYQLELSESGTEHIQGYIEFDEGKSWSELKDMFGTIAYFKRRFRQRKFAREYCMKVETRIRGPWEFGEWNPGREDDVGNQCEYILKGKDPRYSNRRCKNLAFRGKFCGVHRESN